MGTKLRVRVWCVGVGEPGGGEDRADLDPGLQSLLAQSEAFQFVQAIAVGGAAGLLVAAMRARAGTY